MKELKKRQKVWVAGSALLVIGCLWFLTSVYLSKIDIGTARVPAHESDSVLVSNINKQIGAYKLTIGYPSGKSGRFTMAQLGLSLDANASLQATRDLQHRFSHRLAWWQPIKATLLIREDKATFNNFVS
ncbi:MAG TPA: hypothetical protein VLG27_00470, partial [Candidatus Saccharimonadia bacterium]|nr:hypothetical protein [Candidatus Saccharimonadia bacterium]